MDIFSQKKLMTRIIILLLLLNVISIGTVLWKEVFHRPPYERGHKEHEEIFSFLEKELNLTSNQSEQLKRIRSEFFVQEKIISALIRSERDSMNSLMFNTNTNEELVKSIALRVSENEYKMEMLRFEQAKKFKAICNSEQMEKFEGLVKEIRDYFKPKVKGNG